MDGGPITLVGWVKYTSGDGGFAYAKRSSGGKSWGNANFASRGNYQVDEGDSYCFFATSNVGVWELQVITKDSGLAIPQEWILADGGSWTNIAGNGGSSSGQVTDSTSTIDSGGRFQIGEFNGGSTMTGKIAAVAVYDYVLSTAQRESLSTNAAAWLALSPKTLLLLNQANTTDIVPDSSGNGMTQTERVGATISSDNPTSWNFSLSTPLGLITETDTAFSITSNKSTTINQIIEYNMVSRIGPPLTINTQVTITTNTTQSNLTPGVTNVNLAPNVTLVNI